MSKTNKELAIDIAIEYVHGILHQSPDAMPVEMCCEIIKTVYNTLEEIDIKSGNN